jgi:transposase
VGDGIGLAEKMLGLSGVVVLDVEEADGELVVCVESVRRRATCPSCRRRAEAQDRLEVHLRDLHCFGRATRLVIRKRRWRCRTKGCITKTWTEKIAGITARQVLTLRAGAEVTRQVGQLCRSVASVADEYGVAWDTAWASVEFHGRPLVDDPKRVGTVRALGIDEHSYLAATREHTTIYATSLVDLDRRIVIDLFQGKSARSLRRWCAQRPKRWTQAVRVVALDLTDTYRAGLNPHLSHVTPVADPFHVIRAANRVVDQVRRRVQNETLGHRGRKHDPLYRVRKLLLGAPNASTTVAETECCSDFEPVTPTTRCSEHGWRRSGSETSTSPTNSKRQRCCSTTPSPHAPPTRSERSVPLRGPFRAGARRS